MAIDFELDDDQKELGTAARRLFEQSGGLALAREMMGEDTGYSPGVWRQLCELGWLGMAIPAEHGGGGGGLLDLYALYLETGRALVASPHLAVNLVADVLVAAGSAEQQAAWLPRLASGESIGVPAWLESSGTWDDAGVESTLSADNVLRGAKVRVPYVNSADRLLVTAQGSAGLVAALVDRSAPGVRTTRVDNLTGLPLFTVELDGVRVEPGDVIDNASAAVARAVQRGAVLRCAEIAGAGEPVLDLVVDYSKQRVQFGTPIGAHQAVQYLCTDIAILTHFTGLLSLRAAWLIDAGLPADRAAAAAKHYASDAAHQIANRGHEVFAGLAYMMEHDLHLFTRHLKHWEHDLGGTRHHAELLVQALEAS